jgi:hypothetical protein
MKNAWVPVGILILSIGGATADDSQTPPQILFSADFENGATGWTPGGDGDVGITEYKGNHSLKMTRQATATATVQTQGVSTVSIEGAFAAYKLTSHDKCIGEYSIDAGTNWTAFVSVGSDQADGIALHKGHASDIDVSHTPQILVRLRAQLSPADAACWGDNIMVTGKRPSSSG